MIPICLPYNRDNQVGVVTFEEGHTVFRCERNVTITADEFFELFPGAGVTFTDVVWRDGVQYVLEARLFEFPMPH